VRCVPAAARAPAAPQARGGSAAAPARAPEPAGAPDPARARPAAAPAAAAASSSACARARSGCASGEAARRPGYDGAECNQAPAAPAATPAPAKRAGPARAAATPCMVTPAAGSARRQGVQDLGHPAPFPGSAAAAPAPRLSLITPASGAPRAADPGPHPGAAAGAAAGTPAPRLTVQLLPRDAAAAARVAAAGGNPHLELDCKCAAHLDRSKHVCDMPRRGNSRAASLWAVLVVVRDSAILLAAQMCNSLCSGRKPARWPGALRRRARKPARAVAEFLEARWGGCAGLRLLAPAGAGAPAGAAWGGADDDASATVRPGTRVLSSL